MTAPTSTSTAAPPSVLYAGPAPDADLEAAEQPDFFTDLGLDQIAEAVVQGREEYDLRAFLFLPLRDVDAVRYRQEVFADLRRQDVFHAIDRFANEMRSMREQLRQAEKIHYPRQAQAWFLDAVQIYCDAVIHLGDDLGRIEVESRGLRAIRDHVAAYTESDRFRSLRADVDERQRDLASVRYCVHIRGSRVRVTRYEGQEDYSQDVERAFERFHERPVKEHLTRFSEPVDMNHVEAHVLDLVAKLHPGVFGELHAFSERNRTFMDPTIGRFDREVQLYLSYLAFIEPLQSAGLRVTEPIVSHHSKEVGAGETFDLALAAKRISERQTVVTNDFFLQGQERIFVVSGPNQGGKTTFARTFGQLHYLGSLGFPVPGEQVRLFLPDRICTQFEREEEVETLSGKLESDLKRMRSMLEVATSRSVVIMNEVFTSTTLQDALLLSREMLHRIIDLDALCVFVTFLDELSTLSPSTVSMVSTVVPENPAQRTYKVVRKPADGLAYAVAIAEKHRLTYRTLRRRIER